MKHVAIAAVVLTAALVGRRAEGADLGVTVGLSEVAGLPSSEHFGLYPFLGLSLVFPGETVNVIPTLGVECSPELGAWGFVASLTLDFPVHEHLGLDLLLTVAHDQPGANWSESIFYAGIGLGVSVELEEWSLSPGVSVFRGINADIWMWSPGLSVMLAL